MEIPPGSSSVISSGSSPKGIGHTVMSAAGARPAADSKHLVLQAFVHSVQKERANEVNSASSSNVSQARDQTETKTSVQPGNDAPPESAAQQSSSTQQRPATPATSSSAGTLTSAVNAAIRAASADTSAPVAVPQPAPALSYSTPTSTQPTLPRTPATLTSGMSGAAGPYQVELLLNTNRNSPAAGQVDQLNAATMERLAQGQILKLVTQSPVPLVAGSTLTLALGADSAPRILGVNPPEGLSPLLRSVIGAALAHQDGPGPLLASLQKLLQQPTLVSRLPVGLQTTMQQMLNQLPDVHGLRQTGALEKFIAHSGMFWEGSLAKILREDEAQRAAQSDNLTSDGAADNEKPALQEDSNSAVAGDKPGGLFRASGFRQALDHLRQQIRAATTDNEAASATKTATPKPGAPGQATIEYLKNVAGTDFKATLLTLKQQLETASAMRLQGTTREQAPAPVSNNVAGGGQQSSTTHAVTESDRGKNNPAGQYTTQLQTPELGAIERTNIERATIERATNEVATIKNSDAEPAGKTAEGEQSVKNDLSAKNDLPVKSQQESKSDPAAQKGGLEKGGLDKSILEKQLAGKPSAAPASTSTVTTATPGGRYARAVDQYQRMAQITRPPNTSTGNAEENEPVSTDWQWDDLLATGAPVDMDIPGLGLPLPHKLKSRMEGDNDSLENLLGLLLKRTQETINRLHLHQLSHAGATPRDTGTAQTSSTLTFDLPVFFDGQIQVFNTRIDEDEIPAGGTESEGKKVKQWSVSLGFDIDGLGPMFCQLQMAEKQANLQFWADRPATLALTRQNLGFLSQCLNELGVSVTEVTCNEGMPKQTRTRLSQQLVDINT